MAWYQSGEPSIDSIKCNKTHAQSNTTEQGRHLLMVNWTTLVTNATLYWYGLDRYLRRLKNWICFNHQRLEPVVNADWQLKSKAFEQTGLGEQCKHRSNVSEHRPKWEQRWSGLNHYYVVCNLNIRNKLVLRW